MNELDPDLISSDPIPPEDNGRAPLAYENTEFLNSPDGRLVRIRRGDGTTSTHLGVQVGRAREESTRQAHG